MWASIDALSPTVSSHLLRGDVRTLSFFFLHPRASFGCVRSVSSPVDAWNRNEIVGQCRGVPNDVCHTPREKERVREQNVSTTNYSPDGPTDVVQRKGQAQSSPEMLATTNQIF